MDSISTDVAKRKAGQKMSDEDRAALKIDKIIAHTGMFVRTDFGGKDPQQTVNKKAREWAAKKGRKFSDEGFDLLAEFGIEMANHTREGIQTRTTDSREELKRRVDLFRTARQYLDSGHIEQAKRLLDQALDGVTGADTPEVF
jgi:AraC-like DNA-binding protein